MSEIDKIRETILYAQTHGLAGAVRVHRKNELLLLIELDRLTSRLEKAETVIGRAEALIRAKENTVYRTLTQRMDVIKGTHNRMKEDIADYREEKP